MDTIKIRGAREHNLKNINIDIPRDKLVVITGVSGKSRYRNHVVISNPCDKYFLEY